MNQKFKPSHLEFTMFRVTSNDILITISALYDNVIP